MKVTPYGVPFMPLAIVLETEKDVELMKNLLARSTRERSHQDKDENGIMMFQQRMYDQLKARERR